MPYRVSVFMQQKSTLTGGWSQNFWNSTSNLNALVGGITDTLRSALLGCTGAQVFSPLVRTSDAQLFRLVTNVAYPSGQPRPVDSTNPDADYPSTALLIKFRASGGYSTQQWLRGVPDNIITLSGTYQPTSQFTARINKLFKVITDATQTWCLNVLNRSNPFQPITGINGTTGVVTAPLHGFSSGQKVRIKGVHGLTQVNKIWTITVIDSNTFSLNFWTPPAVIVPAYGNKPSARLVSYQFVQISGCEVVRATTHRTGRPTALLSGRRARRPIVVGGVLVGR